jgi:two-component system cell cycle sensor histidine kinase/response regulator CckA
MDDIKTLEPKRSTDIVRLELARLEPGNGRTLDDVLRVICERAADTLEVFRVGIWFFTANKTSLRCVNLFERNTREHSSGVTLQISDFPSYFAALEQRRSIPAEVATDDPRTRQLADRYLKPLGISSLLDAPVYRDGQVIGVVCHEHSGPVREWTTEERDFAASVADMVSLKLKAAVLKDSRAVLGQSDDVLFSIERAESMARIVTEAAHDFKNILTVVVGFANELARADEIPAPYREMAEHILKSGERGAELVRQMTAYGRSEANEPEAIVIADTVRRLLPLLQTGIGPSCRLIFEVEPVPGRVFIDPAQLERVVYNLVTNARDAMHGTGTVSVRVGAAAPATMGKPYREYATLSVSDDGTGMDDATKEKAFEPFFTTKPRGRGSGLGLAIVRRIVERAGGIVQIESELSRGTTVRVLLPFVSRG